MFKVQVKTEVGQGKRKGKVRKLVVQNKDSLIGEVEEREKTKLVQRVS